MASSNTPPRPTAAEYKASLAKARRKHGKEFGAKVCAAGGDTVPGLQRLLAQRSDPKMLDEAAYLCGGLGFKFFLPDLMLVLLDTSVNAAGHESAALAIGILNDPHYIPVLDRAARFHPELAVRYSACNALSLMFDLKAVPTLIAVLDNMQEHQRLRIKAAEALGWLTTRRACPCLMRHRNDPDGEVRTAALLSIGECCGPEAFPVLREIAKDPATPPEVAKVARGVERYMRRHGVFVPRN